MRFDDNVSETLMEKAPRIRRTASRSLLVVGLSVSLASCSIGSEGRQGSALAALGLQSQSTIAVFEAKLGDEVLFALPAFNNQSADPITIESVRVLKVPAGFKVLGYRTLKYTQSDGMMLSWSSRTSKDEFPALALSERGVKGLVIPARSYGDRYALVQAKLTAHPAAALEDVEVVYRQRGTTYHQEMVARWVVRMVGEPHNYT